MSILSTFKVNKVVETDVIYVEYEWETHKFTLTTLTIEKAIEQIVRQVICSSDNI